MGFNQSERRVRLASFHGVSRPVIGEDPDAGWGHLAYSTTGNELLPMAPACASDATRSRFMLTKRMHTAYYLGRKWMYCAYDCDLSNPAP